MNTCSCTGYTSPSCNIHGQEFEETHLKYKTIIEGEERFFQNEDEVIDHVESSTCFEVDSYDLRINLNHLKVHDNLTLRDDCIITRLS